MTKWQEWLQFQVDTILISAPKNGHFEAALEDFDRPDGGRRNVDFRGNCEQKIVEKWLYLQANTMIVLAL